MFSLDEPPPTGDVLRPIRVKPHKRKYPPRACPECGSTATWYKSPRRIYCRQCKRYRALYTADYAGNAAWRALDANNGKYFEEWGTDDTPFDEQAQRELLGLPDTYRVQPHAQRPPCSHCGRTVVRHSYHHLSTGVVCHQCLYSKERAARRMEYANRLLQVS